MNKLLRLNWIVFGAALALVAFGATFIYSAGSVRAVESLRTAWRAHLYTAGFGFVLAAAIACVDYRKIFRWAAVPTYVLSLVMLAAVLVFGEKIYGGRRWLWFFQPSEIAKVAVIVAIAHLFGRENAPRGLKGLLLGLALAVVPALLILAEPDLGTALVLVPTVAAMLLAARVGVKWLVSFILAGTFAAGLVLGTVNWAERQPPEVQARVYESPFWPLKPHQISRIRVFLDKEADPYAAGWNLRQAMISIGSGSISGKGVGKGEQKALGYLPPAVAMNDFIFAVLAEESGFLGCLAMLSLFLALLLSGVWIAFRAKDDRGRLLVVGVTALVFCHLFVNVAMSIGLMPITGLPLPFISAGKTFLVALLAALGLVQSVAVHGADEAEARES